MVTHLAASKNQEVDRPRRAARARQDLPGDSPHTAARYRTSRRAAQGNDQSPVLGLCLISAHHPRAGADPDAVPAELAGRSIDSCPRHHPRTLHREPIPPLCASALKDFPAVGGAHPLEKAVTCLSLAAIWLIRAFHRSSV